MLLVSRSSHENQTAIKDIENKDKKIVNLTNAKINEFPDFF